MGNKNRKQIHAYNPVEMERLRSISLPSKLKCNMCLKNFNQANFSQKQLTDVRYQVSTMGKILTNPKCVKCTGGQLVEIECFMCHKTKGLESFAKSQRKNTDTARCFDCTEIQLARQPVQEKTYDPSNPNNAFIRTERSGEIYPDYWASTNSTHDTTSSVGDYEDIQSSDGSRCRRGSGGIDLSEQFQQAMSVNGGVSDTLIDSEFSQKPANEPRLDTWSEVAGTRSWHTGTATSSSARSNFDPSRYGKPSAGSVSGSVHSFNSSIAERSQTGDDRIEMRNGFAKIKAHKPADTDPWLRDDDRNSSSSSSDNDEDDDRDGEETVI